MLTQIFPADFEPYGIPVTVVEDEGVDTVLIEADGPNASLVAAPLGEYLPGDTLQFAIQAKSITSSKLSLSVQNGYGDLNNLTVYDVQLPEEYDWVIVPAVTVDEYKSRVFLRIYDQPGHHTIQIKQIALGDTDSIQNLVFPPAPPAEPISIGDVVGLMISMMMIVMMMKMMVGAMSKV